MLLDELTSPVVVLPHALGPVINTAPEDFNLRCKTESIRRGWYLLCPISTILFYHYIKETKLVKKIFRIPVNFLSGFLLSTILTTDSKSEPIQLNLRS